MSDSVDKYLLALIIQGALIDLKSIIHLSLVKKKLMNIIVE